MGSRVSGRSVSRALFVGLVIAAGTTTWDPAHAESPVAPAAPPPVESRLNVAQTENGAARAENPAAPAENAAVPVERPSQPATAADIERLRAEVQRLAAAQRDLIRKVDDQGLLLAGQHSVDPAPEAGVGLGPFLVVFGGIVGWAVSRLLQGRRERRQRSRLRF